MKLKDIKANPNNPRVIRDEKFKKLVKSIKEFPKMMQLRPMVINSDSIVLGGNMRLKALKELGYKEIPDEWVKRADELTEEEQRRFIIADNVGFGEHDWEMLANEWDVDELSDWGLDVPDFGEEVLEAEEDDFDTTPPEEPFTVLGDLYEIGEHRLLCGDSTDSDQVAKLMNEEKADMVFTDPDYSMNDDDLFSCYANTLIFSKENFSFWVCADKQSVKLAKNDFENFTHFFIHNYKVPTMVSGSQPMTKHNMICKFGNKKMNNLKDGFSTIVDVATERTLDSHKVTRMGKRVELPAKFIEHYSHLDELILDVFMHSGSTMAASHQLKRKCYGMELEPKYCDVIVNRMIKLDPNITIKRNGDIFKPV